ncbi:MAG: hypothetical protein ABSG84_18685 [Acidobacteriaceae bacterium]|jgi:hypothetical protein
MKLRSLSILAALAGLVGCGGSASSPATSGSTANIPNITGNWELLETSTQAPYTGDATTVGVYLASTEGAISGDASFAPVCSSVCLWPSSDTDIDPYLTGSVDANGNLALTSQFPDGAAPAFAVTAKTPGTTLENGTYTITYNIGSSDVVDQGTVTGSMIAPVNGSYVGTVVSSTTDKPMAVTATLSQTAAADNLGYLYLNGSVAFTSSWCFGNTVPVSFPITKVNFIGNSFRADILAPNTGVVLVILTGTISPVGSGSPSTSAQTLTVGYTMYYDCTDSGYGTLTLQ